MNKQLLDKGTFFPRKRWILTATIFSLGIFLRFFRLNHLSLWYDEEFSIMTSQLEIGEMTSRLIQDFVHPPLHYYLLHGWFQLFGFGASQARILVAIFGSLAVVMMFFLARHLFDTKTGQLSAFLLAISQVSVTYSQEVRSYSQLLFLAVLTTYLFVVSFRNKHLGLWVGFLIASALTIYTHYYGAFVVAALFCFSFFYYRRYRFPMLWIVSGITVIVVMLSPWIASGIIEQVLQSPKSFPVEQPSYFAAGKRTVFQDINTFNNGRVRGVLNRYQPVWTYLMGGLFFVVPLILALARLFRRIPSESERINKENILLLSLLWIPPHLILVLSGIFLNIQYDVRYVAFCAAPYYVLVAYGLLKLRPTYLRPIFILLILLYSILALGQNYFSPYKENYRDALGYLSSQHLDGDCVVLSPWDRLPAQWHIYGYDQLVPRLNLMEWNAFLSSDPKGCDRIWFVGYRRIDFAIRRNQVRLNWVRLTHEQLEERDFHWVNVYLFVPRS